MGINIKAFVSVYHTEENLSITEMLQPIEADNLILAVRIIWLG